MRQPIVAPHRPPRAPALRLGLLAAPLLAAALAWLAPASRAAQAQSPILPPSHAGFPLTIAGAGTVLISQPVIADLGLTPGFAQIVFGTKSGLLYVLRHNGDGSWSPAPGWPKSVGAHIASSPAVADLDGDGIPEIVVGFGSNYDPSHQGGASAFRRDGTLMWSVATAPFSDGTNNWTHAPVYGTPAIGDVDGDGLNEVVALTREGNLYVWDTTAPAGAEEWPKKRHDLRNTGNHEEPAGQTGNPTTTTSTVPGSTTTTTSSTTTTTLPGFTGTLGVRRAFLQLPDGPQNDRLTVRATLALGAGSDGIDPTQSGLSLVLTGVRFDLPPGAFSGAPGRWRYRDPTGQASDPDGIVVVVVRQRGSATYKLKVVGRRAELSAFDGTTDQTIQVRVEIGNDQAAANLPFRRVGRNLRYP